MSDTLHTDRVFPDVVVSYGHGVLAYARAMLTAELLLGEPNANPVYPSPMAWDLLLRVSTLSAVPGAHATDGSPQSQAYEHWVTVLGAYVRRLEQVAREYGRHRATCADCPVCNPAPGDPFTIAGTFTPL